MIFRAIPGVIMPPLVSGRRVSCCARQTPGSLSGIRHVPLGPRCPSRSRWATQAHCTARCQSPATSPLGFGPAESYKVPILTRCGIRNCRDARSACHHNDGRGPGGREAGSSRCCAAASASADRGRRRPAAIRTGGAGRGRRDGRTPDREALRQQWPPVLLHVAQCSLAARRTTVIRRADVSVL